MLAERAGHRSGKASGAGPPKSEQRVGAVQHGVPGAARERRCQWRQPSAWRSEPASVQQPVSALAGKRSAGGLCHQRNSRWHLGISGQTDAFGSGPAGQIEPRRRPAKVARGPAGVPDADLWQLRTGGSRGLDRIHAPAPGARTRQPGSAAEEVEAAERIFNFDTLDYGICPALRHLQAAQSSVA